MTRRNLLYEDGKIVKLRRKFEKELLHTDGGASRKILLRWMYATLIERFDLPMSQQDSSTSAFQELETISNISTKVLPGEGDLVG